VSQGAAGPALAGLHGFSRALTGCRRRTDLTKLALQAGLV
jgi:hypothetical protein